MTWSTPPTHFIDVIEDDLANLRTRIVLDTHRTLVIRSPVRTGRFRGSWGISAGNPINQNRVATASGAVSTGISQAVATRRQVYETVWINNSLPYAGDLERGTSKQAPEGILAITVESIKVRYEL